MQPLCYLQPLVFQGTLFLSELLNHQCFFRLLLFGICRMIKPEGPLDGLLGGRFILAFLSCLASIVAKGVFIGFTVAIYQYPINNYWRDIQISLLTAFTIVGLLFVPQFLVALFSTVGFKMSSLKLLVHHPETVLLSAGW